MNVFIRDVDPMAIKKIDGLARKNGLSRSKYLKMQLENMAMLNALKVERDRQEVMLSKVSDALRLNYERLDKLEQGYEKMLVLITLATGISADEVEAFLKKE